MQKEMYVWSGGSSATLVTCAAMATAAEKSMRKKAVLHSFIVYLYLFDVLLKCTGNWPEWLGSKVK